MKINTIWKQFVETYFFNKINIYNMLNYHVHSFILELIFSNYVIFMLFITYNLYFDTKKC